MVQNLPYINNLKKHKMKKLALLLMLSALVISCNTTQKSLEFLVTNIQPEKDGQTLFLENEKGQLFTTIISPANGNFIDLVKGDKISLVTKEIIEMEPPLIVSKNIKVIQKKHLKEAIISSISMNKNTYKIGESIELEMKVENFGKEKFTFLPWKTPIENSFTGAFMEITFNNKIIEYQGIMVSRMPPSKKDYVTLKPKESITGKINLLDGYKFSKKGVYSVQFDGNNGKLPKSNIVLIEIE